MRISIYKSLFPFVLAVIPAFGQEMSAQTAPARPIKILDISGSGTSGVMKADISGLPEGSTIEKVVTRRFQMSTSNDYPLENSYKTYGGRYIVADLDYAEGEDHYYRMEVTLSDGTVLTTDMYNTGYTMGAVWANDIAKKYHATAERPEGNFSSFTGNPWVGINSTPVTPEDPGRPLQIHPGSTFNYGVAVRATANGSQRGVLEVTKRNEHGAPFTSMRFTMGYQAYAADGGNSTGNGRIIVIGNGAETNWRGNMRACSNSGNPYYFDGSWAANEINSMGLQSNTAGVDNIAVLGALRFYYSVPASSKTVQTVSFDTQGGKIMPGDPDIDLSAYSSAGTPVFFTILKGADIAEIRDGKLIPDRTKSGEVVVEAFTFGDEQYTPASATQSWNFKFGEAVEYLDTRRNSDNGESQTMYLYVYKNNKTLEQLKLEVYDNVRSFINIGTFHLADELDRYAVAGLDNVYALPLTVPGGGMPVHKITYKFAGSDAVESRLYEGNEPFVYMTDIPNCNPLTNANFVIGYGSRYYNKAYGSTAPNTLKTSAHTYAKGYGAHAGGFIQTPNTLDLSQFTRFSVDVGGQVITNTNRGRVGFNLYNGVSTPYLSTGNVPWSNVYEWDFPLQATGPGSTVKVEYTVGGDGNANDVVCIGAPRFYYPAESKIEQTIEWKDEEILNNYQSFEIPLEAVTSSGLPVSYRILSGSEYAEMKGTSVLRFKTIPESEGSVVVEAYQPGNQDYEKAEPRTCLFRLRRALALQKTDCHELEGGSDIDELVIFGDKNSVGQAVVKNGIVNVRKLLLKYTFVPGEWNYVSFPSDLDLDKISDINAKGFTYSTGDELTPGKYQIRKYDSRVRSESPDADPWSVLPTPLVEGMKGYMMKLESDNAEPVEVTFVMDNIQLDFENKLRSMNLSLDLSRTEPGTRHTVYVRPVNVKGNTLRVDVRYLPSSENQGHVNHARALDEMRVTYAQDRSSIRLTLPDQTPAKVAFYDKKGKKLLKSVRYVSPMQIDVSDMKHGTYRMIVVYGPAATERTVEL